MVVSILVYASEWVEALGWYQQEDKNNVTGTGKEWFYHWKADELVRVNPSALVPTLMPIIVKDDNNDNVVVVQEDKAVFESLVTIDYIDAVSGATGKDCLNPLHDPFWAAQCRIWADKVNRDCCSIMVFWFDKRIKRDENILTN
jgi:glutathione S-transferase